MKLQYKKEEIETWRQECLAISAKVVKEDNEDERDKLMQGIINSPYTEHLKFQIRAGILCKSWFGVSPNELFRMSKKEKNEQYRKICDNYTKKSSNK